MSTGFTSNQTTYLRLMGIYLLVLIGFWLRLSFYLGRVYHIDEFISMLAATMVARHGLPILPSGLFYDHGLLFSFISGGFVALLGFSEEVARWPGLLVSVFTIAAYYAAARHLFDSRTTGLLAAVLVTFDGFSIEWGARARMYALAHLFVLLSVVWLLRGTLKHSARRARYLFLLFLIGALFSHTISFLIVPALGILLLVFTLAYRFEWLRSVRLWQEAALALVVLLMVLGVVALGQTGSTVSLQDPTADAPAPLGLEFLRGFFWPGLEWSRFDDLIDFFLSPAYQWLLFAIFLALLAALYRLLRRKATFADIAFVFLFLFLVIIILELGGLLTRNWQKTRYLFILALPTFFLLVAQSLTRLLGWVVYLVVRLGGGFVEPKWAQIIVPLAGVALVVWMWGPEAWDISKAQGTGNYDTAFAFVREHWQSGDRVMSVHPSAAYLYLGQMDYYANQVSAKVLSSDEGELEDALIDRYTGSLLVASVEGLNAVLAEGHRVWFVVDETRLYTRYEPFFTQQVFAQMDVAHRKGGIVVFLSHAYPQPVPAEPGVALNANLGDLVELVGYNLDLGAVAPDGTLQLALYWRPQAAQFTKVYKVFVQLRNEQDQIVAQADHYIYEDLLTASVLAEAGERGEPLRDTADLVLPSEMPSGTYRLLVGLYDPGTFERVPVMADRSGENAVLLQTVTVP